MLERSNSSQTVARIVLSLTIALSGFALVAGLGAAAPAEAAETGSDALVDGDGATCEGCICPQGLADKLGAECAQLDGVEASTDVALARDSPSNVGSTVDCVVQIVESNGKRLDCTA